MLPVTSVSQHTCHTYREISFVVMATSKHTCCWTTLCNALIKKDVYDWAGEILGYLGKPSSIIRVLAIKEEGSGWRDGPVSKVLVLDA